MRRLPVMATLILISFGIAFAQTPTTPTIGQSGPKDMSNISDAPAKSLSQAAEQAQIMSRLNIIEDILKKHGLPGVDGEVYRPIGGSPNSPIVFQFSGSQSHFADKPDFWPTGENEVLRLKAKVVALEKLVKKQQEYIAALERQLSQTNAK